LSCSIRHSSSERAPTPVGSGGRLLQVQAQIAALVDAVDQHAGDRRLGGRQPGDRELVVQVLGQGLGAGQGLLQPVEVAVVAAFARLRPVDGAAAVGRRRGVRRIAGGPLARRGFVVGDVQVGGIVRGVGGGGRLGGGLARRLVRLVALQQRIALQLRLDEGVQLEVGELQKLDRLLQLGGDDQPLPLPDLETRAERQGGRSLWPVSCWRD
jgi:hypothetical protein